MAEYSWQSVGKSRQQTNEQNQSMKTLSSGGPRCSWPYTERLFSDEGSEILWWSSSVPCCRASVFFLSSVSFVFWFSFVWLSRESVHLVYSFQSYLYSQRTSLHILCHCIIFFVAILLIFVFLISCHLLNLDFIHSCFLQFLNCIRKSRIWLFHDFLM